MSGSVNNTGLRCGAHCGLIQKYFTGIWLKENIYLMYSLVHSKCSISQCCFIIVRECRKVFQQFFLFYNFCKNIYSQFETRMHDVWDWWIMFVCVGAKFAVNHSALAAINPILVIGSEDSDFITMRVLPKANNFSRQWKRLSLIILKALPCVSLWYVIISNHFMISRKNRGRRTRPSQNFEKWARQILCLRSPWSHRHPRSPWQLTGDNKSVKIFSSIKSLRKEKEI